jgi:hypothetical protein
MVFIKLPEAEAGKESCRQVLQQKQPEQHGIRCQLLKLIKTRVHAAALVIKNNCYDLEKKIIGEIVTDALRFSQGLLPISE